jgi:type VI secretion system protein ImpC
MIKIRMLNTTKKELVKDFKVRQILIKVPYSRKIYEEEYGSFGGAPYAALIGDFEFDRTPSDMYLLEQISCCCSCACTLYFCSQS